MVLSSLGKKFNDLLAFYVLMTEIKFTKIYGVKKIAGFGRRKN